MDVKNKTFKERLKAACRTNDSQAVSVAFFMAIALVGFLGREDFNPPWWVWIVIIFIAPVTAFIANFKSPIPTEEDWIEKDRLNNPPRPVNRVAITSEPKNHGSVELKKDTDE